MFKEYLIILLANAYESKFIQNKHALTFYQVNFVLCFKFTFTTLTKMVASAFMTDLLLVNEQIKAN